MMESTMNVHIENLPPAILDLKVTLGDIQGELSSLHEESQNVRAAVEALGEEVRVLRTVLERTLQTLDPLHHLSTIAENLYILARKP
jgi:hypothetical protein